MGQKRKHEDLENPKKKTKTAVLRTVDEIMADKEEGASDEIGEEKLSKKERRAEKKVERKKEREKLKKEKKMKKKQLEVEKPEDISKKYLN